MLKTLQPTVQCTVNPFLISEYPLMESLCKRVIKPTPRIFRPDFQPLQGGRHDCLPIYVTRDEGSAVAAEFGFQFPTELQWEYAIRGGVNDCFYFGSGIPSIAAGNAIFNSDFRENHEGSRPGFGVAGMLFGGWCRDTWSQDRYSGLDVGGPYVIKGGAGIYWPWQGCGEWMLALSAMRRSSDELEDGTCSTHFVIELSI